jgi:hypothetical protein
MFVQLALGTDFGPAVLELVQAWVTYRVKNVVACPDAVVINRVRGDHEMEITISVARADERRIKEGFCLRLMEEVGKQISIVPCIYLAGAPHATAKEALHYAHLQS